MTDIASLGISVESSGVDRGVASLDKLTAAAGRAEGATAAIGPAAERAAREQERAAERAARAAEQAAARQKRLLEKAEREQKKAAEKAQRATATHATQLGYQLNDAFVQISSGQSPLTTLIQQGSQITPLYGGLRGTFSALGSGIRALMTPTMALGTSFAALGATAAYGFMRWNDEQKALASSLDGIGRRAGVTASALANLAASGATTGGLSISSGRDLAATYAGAGIDGLNVEKAIGLTKTFARVTGQDLAEAGADLAKALQSPGKGLDTLNEKLGFADAKTRTLIDSFVAQGNVAGAQRALIAALAKDLDKAADRTGALGKAWEWVKRVSSDAATNMGRGIDNMVFGTPDEEKLASVVTRLAAAKAEMGSQVSSGAGRWGMSTATADAANAARIREMEAEANRLQKRVDRANDRAAEDAADQSMGQRSTTQRKYVESMLPELERRRTLTDQIINLQSAMDSPTMLDKMGVSAKNVADAIAQMNDQLGQTSSALDKIQREGDLAVRGINARSVKDRALLARDRTLGGVAWEDASPELRAKAEADSRLEFERARKEAQDRLRSANDNSALAGLPSYRRSQMEIDRKYALQNEIDAGSSAALAANEQTKRAELAALAQSSITGPMADANRALESQNRLLNVNIATFGLSTDKVVAAKTAQEQFNRYTESGIPITQQMRDSVNSYAEGMGKLALAEEEAARKQKAVISGMDDLRSTSSSVFKSLLRGDTKGALRMLGDKALDNGANFLTEQLFGKQGKPGGGLLGDTIGSLFGASQGITVGSQTVTAGVVNLNGGIGGLGGAGGAGGAGGLFSANGGKSSAESMASLKSIYSGGSGGLEGLNPEFASRLSAFASANPGVSISSAYRSPERQKQLWDEAVNKYGSEAEARKWVAPPGQSYHNRGLAADLSYASPEAMARAHATAGQYGLKFPLSNENWHVEPIGARNGGAPLDLSKLNATNGALERFQMTTTSATTDLGTFGGGLGKMGSALFNSVTGQGGGGGGLLGGLIGLLFGGLKFGSSSAAVATPTMGGLYANGGAFSRGNVIPFAAGGVVGGPTHFSMSGGRTGLMGEAGPEAIMPLGRDRAGRLGIRMAGPAPRREAAPANTIVIGGHNITMHGEASPETREWLRGEMDRRDAISAKRFEQTLLVQNRRQAGMKG